MVLFPSLGQLLVALHEVAKSPNSIERSLEITIVIVDLEQQLASTDLIVNIRMTDAIEAPDRFLGLSQFDLQSSPTIGIYIFSEGRIDLRFVVFEEVFDPVERFYPQPYGYDILEIGMGEFFLLKDDFFP